MDNSPPFRPGTEQFRCSMGTYTFSEGILAFYVDETPLTLEKMVESFGDIKRTINHQRVKGLVEVSPVQPLNKELMEYASTELPSVFSALAVISKSPVATLVANIFLHLMHPPVPIRLFSEETEARKWLQELP